MTPLTKIPNFNARSMPVLGIDSHLPVVPPERMTATALMRRFAAPPPWQPEVVAEKKFTNREPAHASVLVPLVLREAGLTVLLTQRTEQLANHSGQIAFPGGRADEGDADAVATALRETQEEVGLQAHHMQVLGTLPLYVTGTAFIITPVVALVQSEHTLTLSAGEVANAFEIPLAFLMNPAHHHRHAFEWEGIRREWFSMPWQGVGEPERFVWGATAGMLRNLYRFLSA